MKHILIKNGQWGYQEPYMAVSDVIKILKDSDNSDDYNLGEETQEKLKEHYDEVLGDVIKLREKMLFTPSDREGTFTV